MIGKLICTDTSITQRIFDISFPTVTGKETYVICPVCTPSRKPEHQKEKKLSINYQERTARCNHCDRGFKFVEDHEFKVSLNDQRLEEINSNIGGFLQKRKISQKTIHDLQIKMKVVSLKQKDTGEYVKKPAIAFIYSMDNKIYGIKFRDGKKNFSFEKDSKLILWGMDRIYGSNECLITEGEIDAASYYEAGYPYSLSVPNGVTITEKEKYIYEKTGKMIVERHLNLKYLDECIKNLEEMETIFIGTDADAAGVKLREELIRRLGRHRCKVIDYGKYQLPNGKPANDGNDVLVHLGPEVLLKTITDARGYKISDIIEIDDVWNEIEDIYVNGVETGHPVGYPSLRNHFRWNFGDLVVLNGYPNMGKSAFALNLIALSAILHNMVWGLYMPENYPVSEAYIKIIEVLLGNTMDKIEGRIQEKDMNNIKEFIHSHFKFVNKESGYEPGELREVTQAMIKLYGISGMFTDPWNSLIHRYKSSLDDYLENELSAEQRFSINHRVIKMISAHPPTPERKPIKELGPPSPSMIRGGSIWWNKAYAMLCIHHYYDENSENSTKRKILVQKIKDFKKTGIPTFDKFIVMDFVRRSGRYIETDGFDPFQKEKSEQQPEINFTEF